jgi:replicative DNA helicase
VKYRVSLFNHKADNVPRAVERAWSDITRKMQRPPIRSEKDGPLYSPATFDPAHRLLKNVREVSMLVLDYDHNANFNDDLQPWRERCAFAAHTTFSHSESEHRFRVVIPLAEPIPNKEFPRLWKWAAQVSGGKIDAAASDASRMYYVPVRASERAPYLSEIHEGDPLNWRELDLPELDQPQAPRAEPITLNLSDQELLEKAFASKTGSKIRNLYDGQLNGHASQSHADLALCSHLAFWSGGNPLMLDQWFRSSRLYREKWDKRHAGDGRTYGEVTIDKALANCTEFYRGPGGQRRQVEPVSEHQNVSAPSEWEPPATFYEHSRPQFPVDVLPDSISPFAEGLACETQTPVDLPAMLALTIAAGAIAGKVRAQARLGWTEPTNIYCVCVLPPGNRKSAVFQSVSEPLEEIERDLVAATRDEIAKAASEYRMMEERKARLEKEASRADNPEDRRTKSAEAISVAQQLAAARVPVAPRLLVSDVTSEVVSTLLAEQGGRITMLSTEGGIFETIAGRYSAGVSNIDVYLKGNSGDPLRVDRRGRSEFVQHPALTIGLTVQPDVIGGLAKTPGFRGRGLLGRFLYCLPQSTVGTRQIDPQPLSETHREQFRRTIRSLSEIEASTDRKGDPAPRMLYLTADANALLKEFERELEPKLVDDGELGALTDWAGKLAGAVVRLAAILWLTNKAENLMPWPDKIDADTMRSAISLGEYLTQHARAAFAEMGADANVENAKRILRWIEKSAALTFTRREAHQAHRARFKTVDEIDPALDLLESHNYIRAQIDTSDKRPGRKASQTYDVNPFFFSDAVNRPSARVVDRLLPADLVIPASVPNSVEAIDGCIDSQRV